MTKYMLFITICVAGLGVTASTCDRPSGRIVPLSSTEKAEVLAPPVETAKLEARLTCLERLVSGTAINNRLDAGDINQSVTPTMRAEFAALEKEWSLRHEEITNRLTALRKHVYNH